MLIIRCIYVLHLLVTSGTGFIDKYVCLGDSVKVFETVTFTSQNAVVSLYMNYQIRTLIAQWHMQNLTIKPHIQPEYKEKVYLDDYGNIWIRNVNHWDEDSYFIESNISSSYVQYEVRIIMKVAPNKNCKPKITHLDKFLIAHLEAEDCGKPLVSLQWLDHPGFSNTSGSVINLPPGKEAGIYYACVEGPALECAKISMPSDYCSSYTIGENNSPSLLSDMLDLKTAISVIVPSIIAIGSLVLIIAIGYLVLVIVALYLIPKIRRRIRRLVKRIEEEPYSETENKQGKETIPLLDISQQQEKQFVSDADKPNLSLKRRFSGRTHDNSRKCWLLDLVLNPDDDLIVTDGENNELKKFSLEGTLKSKLSFKTRPDCLALTDGYLAMVTFPHETVLRVIDTGDELSLVSTIPFRSQCAGIGSMNDGRLIICNRELKSVIVCSKDGEILQEIKTGSSGETLFRKPSYVRVVDSRTIYVSDNRTREFFIININDDNTFTINKRQINYPRTSCVVDGMLLVASSNIRLFTLDGNEAGEVTLNGVHHVRGLAFSEGKRLLVITHQIDGGDEVISVYEVMKH